MPDKIVSDISGRIDSTELNSHSEIHDDLFALNNIEEVATPNPQQKPIASDSNERIVYQLHAEHEDPDEIIASPIRDHFVPVKSEEINSDEDQQRKLSQERVDRLKKFNFKRNYADMESKPAYQRKNIPLNNVPSSNESSVSRFTLGEGEDQKGEIRPNNSFLHDSVD
jgi:cell division protein FtsZ